MGSILLDRFFPATYNLHYALSGLHCMLCISGESQLNFDLWCESIPLLVLDRVIPAPPHGRNRIF